MKILKLIRVSVSLKLGMNSGFTGVNVSIDWNEIVLNSEIHSSISKGNIQVKRCARRFKEFTSYESTIT